MSGLSLYATIEKRLETLTELSRRNQAALPVVGEPIRPTVTISREFGCEGFAVAEKVQSLIHARTGTVWGLMDKAIVEKFSEDREHTLEVLKNLGEKNPFLDDMMSTLLTAWKSDKDYYQLLCNQIVPFARGGHVIIVGLGAGILTQGLPNCYHFRIVAPMEFRIRSVAQRHDLSVAEAEKLIQKNQKQRIAFINEFLNRDIADPLYYSIVFNRAYNTIDEIAEMICYRVLADQKKEE
ncbi:cytidylate kinase-like family protein [Geomesophilobacter sediminis]|uniref:Cytidylate kinase-like family protein n=1 Tax=Geomesophilobacter sediminis TaxID=2798584 RepID=A0A8J7M3A7_9BACT|nr:cytidylate kinase-like family protein [Geomesophilobacter sediminis]MBJ6727877.1 cytidylate kinase-like family protein [Geomesophilobacter sediminis]